MAEPSWVPHPRHCHPARSAPQLVEGEGVEEPAVVLRSTRSKEKTKMSAENLPILANFLQNYLYFDA
jgi:hypothetical protein